MKKSVSLLLSFLMVIGVITSMPIIVSAESSGTCGENAVWTFDDGVLTISGTGAMGYYDPELWYPPWVDFNDEIKEIVIEHGITEISGFFGCVNLNSVEIPDTVNTIHWATFSNCEKLSSIEIPRGIESIGVYAFSHCYSLTSIIIPDTVTAIYNWAFFECTKLVSITIPDSVTLIGADAFKNTAYYNNDNNWVDNVLYIDNHLISAKNSISGSYKVKDGTKTISERGFYECNSLTSITIPDGVVSIGSEAFWGCGLTSIVIPDSVKDIEENALGYCYENEETYEIQKIPGFTIKGSAGSAAEVYANENEFEFVEDSKVVDESVLTFELNEDGESYSVTKCDKSAEGELIIPEVYNGLPVTNIGEGAFYNCDSLTSIIIPDSVTSIGDYAFENSTSLTSITIPDSVISIGELAFNQTGYYNDINNWENSVLYIDNHLIYSKVNGDCIIKDGTKTIANDAFSYTGLTSITFPDSITNIGFYAFNNCNSLENVYISDISTWCNITFSNAFANPLYYADGLYINGELATDIDIPDNVTQLNDFIFYNYFTLTSVTIPDCVTSIGKSAFYNCANLSSVKIPVNVTSIGAAAFYNCVNLNEIYWNAQCVEDFVSYSEVFYNAGTEGSGISLVFGDSVKKIPAYLFYVNYSSYNPEIISVTISDSVTSIGFGAFYNCNRLTNVYYAGDNTQWTKINIADKNECLLGAKIHCGLTEKIVTPKLKSIQNTQYGVLIKWGKVTGAELYRIYRKIGTGSYEYIGSTSNAYFTDKKASAGKTCRYRIRAKNEAGYSEYSASLAIKHIDEPTLKLIENSAYGVLIKWGKVTGAQKYSVYRKVSGGEYEYLGATSNTYYTDKTAKSGKKYYYAIRGKRDDSVSSQSESLSKYHLADPTLNTPTSTSKGVGLRWSKVTGASGYMVYRRTTSGSYTRIKTEKGVSNVTYRDTTAKKGTKYYYKVKAYYSKTYSAYSNTKSVTDKY